MVRDINTIVNERLDAIQQDPGQAEGMLRAWLREALRLSLKSEWSMEDNFSATEWLGGSGGDFKMSSEEVRRAAAEFGIDPDEIDWPPITDADEVKPDYERRQRAAYEQGVAVRQGPHEPIVRTYGYYLRKAIDDYDELKPKESEDLHIQFERGAYGKPWTGYV